MKISLYHGIGHDKPGYADDVIDTPWEKVPELILKNRYSPGVFENMHRSNANLISIELLGLDVDEGCSIEEAMRAFDGYRCIIGTTKNHQRVKVKASGENAPPCDRFRILLPLEKPITNDQDFKATWHQAQKFLPSIDRLCKDSARYFDQCVEIVHQSDGKSFPVTAATYVPKVKTWDGSSDEPKGILARHVYEFITNPPSTGWRHAFVKAIYELKQNNYSKQEAYGMLKRACTNSEKDFDEGDWATFNDIYDNRPVYPPRRPLKSGTSPATIGKPPIGRVYQPKSEEARVQEIEEERRLRKSAVRIPFCCSAFDEVFPIPPGLTVIGSITGGGKTTANTNIVAHGYKHCPAIKSVIISNEESQESIISRIACVLLGKDWHKYHANALRPSDIDVIHKCINSLLKRIDVVTDKEFDMTCLEDVQSVLDHAADNANLVVVDYLQTVTSSRDNPGMEPVQVSKALGFFLKDYAKRVPIPVVVFAQLYPDEDGKSFSSRIQNDRTIVNHAVAAIEVIRDSDSETTEFRFHKMRNSSLPKPITVRWVGGRYEPLPGKGI